MAILTSFFQPRLDGPVAQYPFWLFLPKSGYDLLKIPRNSPAIPHNFQLRLARILKELSQKHIRQQALKEYKIFKKLSIEGPHIKIRPPTRRHL